MSDQSAWTPGPWRVDETKALGAQGVWTDYPTHPGYDGAGYPSLICSFEFELGPRKQRDANAKLIAAAPDLVAALQAVRKFGSRGELDDGTTVSYLVESALAKAGVT